MADRPQVAAGSQAGGRQTASMRQAGRQLAEKMENLEYLSLRVKDTIG